MIYLDVGGDGPGLVDPHDARVPATDRGLLYGDGLFETMLLRSGEIPLLPLHMKRMAASAAALAIPFDAEMARAGALALAATVPGSSAADEFALRITLTRGANGQRGFLPPSDPLPTLMITVAPYRRPSGPLSAVTASFRTNPHSPLAAHKTLSAMEKVLGRSEAARAGCDEALLLNLTGRVAEATSANLFIVRQGLWMTPPLTEGCLPGVMRRQVLALTGGVEYRVTPEDLYRCDGVYLTNALMGCLPLAALDGRSLPWGAPPPFLPRLWERRPGS